MLSRRYFDLARNTQDCQQALLKTAIPFGILFIADRFTKDQDVLRISNSYNIC